MQLSRQSRLARFSYFGPFGPMPMRTSLCAFFWQTFVFVPMFWAFIVGLSATALWLVGGVVWAHRGLWPWALFFVSLIAFISVAIIYEDEIQAWHQRHPMVGIAGSRASHAVERRWDAWRESFFVRGLKTLKGKLCPIIELR